METCRGFSLIEVLFSLSLMSLSSLSLFAVQSHLAQLMQQFRLDSNKLITLDNKTETAS